MRLFSCERCGQWVFFDDLRCERCGTELGYLSATDELVAVERRSDGTLYRGGDPTPWRRCSNGEQFNVCGWLVGPDDPGDGRCTSCLLNRVIPDLAVPGAIEAWRRMEEAKRRVVRALLRMGLPVVPRAVDPRIGLAFDFLGVPHPIGESGVVTGHDDGVITIDIAEAHDAVREARRLELGEHYRTLLGHIRHEVGHRYWEVLVPDHPRQLSVFRDLFGDERDDYQAALRRHYVLGPRPDWAEHHITAYASAHPWEDWAETWAHHLHIWAALETCGAFGMRVRRPPSSQAATPSRPPRTFSRMVSERWLPAVYALNSVNRAMGEPDLYPFVLTGRVLDKLDAVDAAIRAGRRRNRVATLPEVQSA